MRKFDLFVTGSRLEPADISEAGWSVAIIEEDPFDGTCLNQGCIPSKMLIHCADVMRVKSGVTAINQSIYVHLALPRRCKGRSVNRPSDHNRSATCIW